MITIVCGTNRPGNVSQSVCKVYLECLKELGEDVAYLSMEDVPRDFVFRNGIISSPSEDLEAIVEKYINRSNKFIIVSPEYNGSYPGVLKSFIDSIPPQLWNHKKVALTGVASGRAGNLRGMDHLTNVFNYMKAIVFPDKLPISRINELMDDTMTITDEVTLKLIENQINGFLKF